MQIGLVLLIALSAKNAILVVEMARQKREEGMPILEAAVEGARLRFRPILMTSFTFILGVRAAHPRHRRGERRPGQSLGIAVASGMLASTCLGGRLCSLVLRRAGALARTQGPVAVPPAEPVQT